MCDTIYAGPAAAGFRRAWFAKNSDRNPAEPQALCIVPRDAKGSLSFVLSRPTWMRGGEMGVNERGVAIGNEAVFPRIKPKKDGVLGMVILREALSRLTTREGTALIKGAWSTPTPSPVGRLRLRGRRRLVDAAMAEWEAT